MAQRGTIFASVTNSGAYSGKLVWIGSYSVKSQDPKTNKTVLTLYGTMHNTNSAYAAYNSYDCNFQVDSKVMGSGYMGFPNEWTELGTKEVTITHNTDGSFPTTRYSIYADSYHFDGQSASGTVTAPALDRAAPTISTLTTSSITASGFTFTATTNVNCNKWEYSLNNGSTWTTFSTTDGTSASKSLTGLNPATTYTVLVRVTKTVNDITAQKSVSAATLGYATLTTVPNCNVDTATDFTYDVKATGFYYKLFFYNGSSNIKTVTIGGGKSVGSNTQSVTLEGDLLSTVTSATITARLITYSSSAYSSEIGRSEKNFTLTVPNTSAYQPSVAIAISPYNTNAWIRDSATYKYWGGFTAVDITLTPTANGGADVSSYGVSSPTTTKTDTYTYRTSVLNNGVTTISATVTDSRGRTATASTTVSMAYYSAPAVSSASAERGTYSSGTWTADNNGDHIRLYITGTCSLTNYGNSFTMTPTISGQTTPIQSGNYYYWTGTSSNSSYTIDTVLVDNTGTSSTHTLSVSSASVPFNLNTSMPAAAFGKVAETAKSLELASDWRFTAKGKYNMMDYYPYSFVATGASNAEGYAKIATVTVTGTWYYTPIQFTIERLLDRVPVNLYLSFEGANTSDPTINSFWYTSAVGVHTSFDAFATKTTTSTWEIYVKKVSASDTISVRAYVSYFAQSRCNISFSNNLLTSKPSGATTATPCNTLGIYAGTCTTAAATAAKVATVNGGTYFPLIEGTTVYIKFSSTNSAAVSGLTLNVNNTGAKSIVMLRNGNREYLSSYDCLRAGCACMFTYSDGYWWFLNADSDHSWSAMTQAEATAGTVTTARVISPQVLKNSVLALVYPVGSIYMSVNSTSPATFIGGTWTQLKDRFLLGAGSTYTAGNTGGEATHTLTTSEMPAHSHTGKYANTDGHYSGSSTEVRTWSGSGTDGTGRITNEVGGGGAHNNMPPYLVVYMWKRTA